MLPILENGCGTCTACCTVLGVKELRKDDYKNCTHLCGGGCAIYQSRPKECQTYECLWRASSGKLDELRPDKLGVILEPTQTSAGQAVVVREVWLDASKSDLAQQFIDLVAEQIQGFIYIVRPDNTRSVHLPPWSQHLAPLIGKIKHVGWRDAERQETNPQRENVRRVEDLKKRRKKLAKIAKRRNR